MATAMIDQKVAWPVSARTASTPELTPRTDWVKRRMRRRGSRSARSPPPREDHGGQPVGSRHRGHRRGAVGQVEHEVAERHDLHPGAKQRGPLRDPVPAERAHAERGRRPAPQRRRGQRQRPHSGSRSRDQLRSHLVGCPRHITLTTYVGGGDFMSPEPTPLKGGCPRGERSSPFGMLGAREHPPRHLPRGSAGCHRALPGLLPRPRGGHPGALSTSG